MTKIDLFDNESEGNYWSDYEGVDSNGDGIGDTAYVIDSNRSDSYPLMSLFNITAAPNLMPNWAKNQAAIVLTSSDEGQKVALP